jgi:hypothetical protein
MHTSPPEKKKLVKFTRISRTVWIFFCVIFQNQGKPGHEVQSSTLELMNGLVSLVHQQCMPDVASEAMEVSHRVMRS